MNAKEISLEEKELKPIVDHLNDLLANYHVHYQKLRGCHWNIKGSHFFTLHIKFEELYTNAQLTIDELAERILTIGKSPYSTFSEYLEISKLKEINTIGVKDTDLVDITRKIIPYYNAHVLLKECLTNNFKMVESENHLDKWIKMKLVETTQNIYKHMEKLELPNIPIHIYLFAALRWR